MGHSCKCEDERSGHPCCNTVQSRHINRSASTAYTAHASFDLRETAISSFLSSCPTRRQKKFLKSRPSTPSARLSVFKPSDDNGVRELKLRPPGRCTKRPSAGDPHHVRGMPSLVCQDVSRFLEDLRVNSHHVGDRTFRDRYVSDLDHDCRLPDTRWMARRWRLSKRWRGQGIEVKHPAEDDAEKAFVHRPKSWRIEQRLDAVGQCDPGTASDAQSSVDFCPRTSTTPRAGGELPSRTSPPYDAACCWTAPTNACLAHARRCAYSALRCGPVGGSDPK